MLTNGKEWLKIKDKLVVVGGVLFVVNDGLKRVVVPESMVLSLLKMRHDSPLEGHRDFDKTYEKIRKKYFWFQMQKDIKHYCATCHLCQTKKHLSKPNKAPLKPIIVNTPWSLIGIDVTDPLKKTSRGNLYVIVAVDYFTKFCVAKAIPDFTAETTAKFVFEEIICKLGAPKGVMSDQGVNFKAKMFKKLCELCKISSPRKWFSGTYEQNSQANFNNVFR